uniref:Putative transposon protein n=1 Tax=Phyllostachys edulis TaxID=38705 RepID=D3IVK3_PHYED|nr:putative transposon protein [Phyllostachys edulis]
MAEAPKVVDAVDEDPVEVAPTVRQVTGLADEGEEMEAVVNRMDLEDRDYMALSEDEGSDDEDDVDQQVVPSNWNIYQFENLVVNESPRVPWEYDQSEVRLGAMYKCKEVVQDTVKFWALLVRRTFKVVKSTPRFYDVKYGIQGCPWRVHAFQPKWATYWKCSIVVSHTCVISESVQSHRNLSSGFIANLMYNGTFLTGKYKGQILTAIATDGNNQVLPVAFAFVESENTDSWLWFLKNSRWCMRHLGANFYKQFRNKDLMNMFKQLCNQNQQRKFEALQKILKERTKTHRRKAERRVTPSADQAPEAFSQLPTDAPRLTRRTGAQAILCGTTNYFVDRSNNASLAMANDRIIMITKYMGEKSKKGEMHPAFKMGTREVRFEIMCRDKGRRGTNRERITHECMLRCGSCTCTCNMPLLLHRLCSHVIATCSTVARIPVGTQKCNSGPSVYNALVQDHASAHSGNINEISFPYTKITNE